MFDYNCLWAVSNESLHRIIAYIYDSTSFPFISTIILYFNYDKSLEFTG